MLLNFTATSSCAFTDFPYPERIEQGESKPVAKRPKLTESESLAVIRELIQNDYCPIYTPEYTILR